MAIIQSGDNSENSLATVDTASNALRGVRLAPAGQNNIADENAPNNYYSSQKATYAACLTAKNVQSSAGVGPFFVMTGSSKKLVRVLRIVISATIGTTAAYQEVVLNKRYQLVNDLAGQTLPTALFTPVPLDSNSPRSTLSFIGFWAGATSLVTTGPTDPFASLTRFLPITGTPARMGNVTTQDQGLYDFNFTRGDEMTAPILTGPANAIEAVFGTAPGTVVTLMVGVTWTEE